MLVKLTTGTGVDFINILHTAFTCADPKSAKRHWWLDCIFALLGSWQIKAARKHVGEINPWAMNFGYIPGLGISIFCLLDLFKCFNKSLNGMIEILFCWQVQKIDYYTLL